MPSKEYIRRYKFDLRDIAPPGILSFEAEGKDISDAMDNLAKELGEDPIDISTTLEAAYVWNPVKKEWVPHRPWWEEEKEPYEWELNPGEFTVRTEIPKAKVLEVTPRERFEFLSLDNISKCVTLNRASVFRLEALRKKVGEQTAREIDALVSNIGEINEDLIEMMGEMGRRWGQPMGALPPRTIDPSEMDRGIHIKSLRGRARATLWQCRRALEFVKGQMRSLRARARDEKKVGEIRDLDNDLKRLTQIGKDLHSKWKKIDELELSSKSSNPGFTTFNGISRESYYLNFNKDEIFKSLIASEGHFRNFTSLKEDTAGYLNCIVKHLADAEGHCDEAISHALIAESEDSSSGFLELRDKIRDFRRYIQSSPITRDEGIREIRKLRRRFEAFNPDYDVSKCETCGDPAEVMEEITRILNDLKKTPLEVAAHEHDDFLEMERDMAEKLIAKLSEKYGVKPPEIVISEDCHEPNAGLYSAGAGEIMVCQTGVNLHVLAHEFWHHVQKEKGMHMDEGEAERFAVDLFKQPIEKGLYALHSYSHNDRKMVEKLKIKDVAVVYGGQHIGQGIERAMQWVDTQYPAGIMGIPLSLITDIIGAIGGVAGALYLGAPYDLLTALIGGHLSTDLWRHAEAFIMPLGMPVAVPPSRVYSRYTVKPQPQIPPTPVPRGRYQITG